jgi:hypothetical protein
LKIKVIGNWKFRGKSHKTGVAKRNYLPFPSIKPGTRLIRVNREVSISSIQIIGIFIKEE